MIESIYELSETMDFRGPPKNIAPADIPKHATRLGSSPPLSLNPTNAPGREEVLMHVEPLTRTAGRGRGVHRGAEGPGRDFGWLESHLRRRQSSSATTERRGFLCG